MAGTVVVEVGAGGSGAVGDTALVCVAHSQAAVAVVVGELARAALALTQAASVACSTQMAEVAAREVGAGEVDDIAIFLVFIVVLGVGVDDEGQVEGGGRPHLVGGDKGDHLGLHGH